MTHQQIPILAGAPTARLTSAAHGARVASRLRGSPPGRAANVLFLTEVHP